MRKFRWCRREIAADCTLNDVAHVHICITETTGRTLNPPCGNPALNLYFHDLEPASILRNKRAGENPEIAQIMISECFRESDAQKIAQFVQETPENKLIIVNCAAGVSRSPGVVLALRRFYGGDTEEVFQKAHPNIHVAHVLERILRDGPEGPQPDAGRTSAPTGLGEGESHQPLSGRLLTDIPAVKGWPPGSAQCHFCGGHGCFPCQRRGWYPPETQEDVNAERAAFKLMEAPPPADPRRKCENSDCKNLLPPDQVAIYCSNDCARMDA